MKALRTDSSDALNGGSPNDFSHVGLGVSRDRASHPVWGYTVDCLEILHAVEQLHEVEQIDDRSGNPAGNGSYAYLGK